MEFAGRGGPVPTNRISLRDVVIFGGESPEVLGDGLRARPTGRPPSLRPRRGGGRRHLRHRFEPRANGAVVEFAQLVKERGHRLIAITSFTQTTDVTRHPSGAKLIDHADVALDNGAPYGDAVLLPGGGTACAVSSITAALLAQLVVAEVVRRLLEAGEAPRVCVCQRPRWV